jgi:hypothetical protein
MQVKIKSISLSGIKTETIKNPNFTNQAIMQRPKQLECAKFFYITGKIHKTLIRLCQKPAIVLFKKTFLQKVNTHRHYLKKGATIIHNKNIDEIIVHL